MIKVMRFLAMLILLAMVWETASFATSGGGTWKILRTRGYSSSMGTVSQNVFTRANSGAVLLSVNYFTMIDSITAGDSVRTAGLDSAGLYYLSSDGSDTTVLYLDGYVDQLIQVAFFFDGITANTLSPVSVWQGLSYNQTLQDSGGFRWGMIPTDTLFTDSLNAARTQMDVSAATTVAVSALITGVKYEILSIGTTTNFTAIGASASTVGIKFTKNSISGNGNGTVGILGERSRVYTDNFLCVSPAMFIQFANKAGGELENDIYIELYARHKDSVMSGVSGRLQHNIEKSIKPPSSRRRR